MQHSDYLRAARYLADANSRRPRQVDLRRAVSSTYYAMFHCLARNCADLLARTSSGRNADAWRQSYRALQHGTARSRCQDLGAMRSFTSDIRNFGRLFVEMQQKRHSADYDPDARFKKSDVVADIDRIEDAITRFAAVPPSDRRAFAIYVLLARRQS